MPMQCKWKLGMLLAALTATGCVTSASRPPPGDLLFAWASDADRKDSDFLAVIDLRANQVVTTVPVGQSGTLAHHTDYEMPADCTLLASDFYGNRTWFFDLCEPRAPKLRWSFADAGPISFAHSFARLPNRHILATFQRGDHANRTPGGIAEFATDGRLLRWSSAADPRMDEFVRPYSLAIVSKLDRIVTTTADMGMSMPAMPDMPAAPAMPAMKAEVSRSIQIWRMSDLKLLRTLILPAGPRGTEQNSPNEPRLLSDGRTVMVGTGNCGLYRVGELNRARPAAELVYALDYKACAVPVVVGHYWVVAVGSLPGLVALDVADPSHPREVSRLVLDAEWMPHWISLAPDGRRIVITGFKRMRSKILLAAIDPVSGTLALTGTIDFDRASWPHGATGAAIPHGTVFARPR
jgi:hypothetical protein